MTRVVICCGVGGTGKTTTAAAMAVSHALAGQKVVVLTIDPARRLGDALGLRQLANEPTRVPLDAPGTLHALMLDRKGTWDAVVRRFSTPEAAESLFENRYYRAVSERLTGSHEYMAIEKLHDLVERAEWDVVIIDTPPTQHALDFFRAPDRVRKVLDRTVLNVILSPGRGFVGAAGDRAFRLVRRLAGDRVMGDIREFFRLFSGMSGGFRERSRQVHELLTSDRTSYFLVAAARDPARSDVLGFLDEIRRRRMQFSGFLVNRVAPDPDVGVLTAGDLGDAPAGIEAAEWQAWTEACTTLVNHNKSVHGHQLEAARHLAKRAGGANLWLVPDLQDGVRTLEGLTSLAQALPPLASPAD